MCYAIPGKVLSIRDDSAVVDYDGVQKEANVSLLGKVSVGDFVLVHAGFAIQVIDTVTADESLINARRMVEHGQGP